MSWRNCPFDTISYCRHISPCLPKIYSFICKLKRQIISSLKLTENSNCYQNSPQYKWFFFFVLKYRNGYTFVSFSDTPKLTNILFIQLKWLHTQCFIYMDNLRLQIQVHSELTFLITRIHNTNITDKKLYTLYKRQEIHIKWFTIFIHIKLCIHYF